MFVCMLKFGQHRFQGSFKGHVPAPHELHDGHGRCQGFGQGCQVEYRIGFHPSAGKDVCTPVGPMEANISSFGRQENGARKNTIFDTRRHLAMHGIHILSAPHAGDVAGRQKANCRALVSRTASTPTGIVRLRTPWPISSPPITGIRSSSNISSTIWKITSSSPHRSKEPDHEPCDIVKPSAHLQMVQHAIYFIGGLAAVFQKQGYCQTPRAQRRFRQGDTMCRDSPP